jgi:lysozyme
MSPMGLALLGEWEGFRLVSYPDSSGFETIGVGHLVTDSDRKLWQHMRNRRGKYVITEAQALILLAEDVAKVELALYEFRQTPMENTHIFDALCSFLFNVGVHRVSLWWVPHVLLTEDIRVAERKFPLWNRSKGEVVRGLTVRRHEELAWMRKGVKHSA